MQTVTPYEDLRQLCEIRMVNSNDKKIRQISCENENTCPELSSPHCSGNCSKDPISCLNFVKKKRRWGSSHRVF